MLNAIENTKRNFIIWLSIIIIRMISKIMKIKKRIFTGRLFIIVDYISYLIIRQILIDHLEIFIDFFYLFIRDNLHYYAYNWYAGYSKKK